MKTDPKTVPATSTKVDGSLAKVLGQNEQVKDLVEECAEDLSSVNTNLKEELGDQVQPPAVENAIEKSEATETKVLEAVGKLTDVNKNLENEVHELHSLQQKLAATVDQAEASRAAALHDVLTGLPNRTLFNDRLEHGLEQAKRHGWTLAVMFVDLDGFKLINDSHGHGVGDSVLQTIAARLKANARSDDTVSRHGGDEFLYLLMGSGAKLDISPMAANIIKAIQAPCEISIRNVVTSVTINASIGIAIFPKDGATAESLVKSADDAMYQAKRNKSGYLFAGTSPSVQPALS